MFTNWIWNQGSFKTKNLWFFKYIFWAEAFIPVGWNLFWTSKTACFTHALAVLVTSNNFPCQRRVAKAVSKLDFHSMNVSHVSINIFVLPIRTLAFFLFLNFPPVSSSSPTPNLTFYPMYVFVCVCVCRVWTCMCHRMRLFTVMERLACDFKVTDWWMFNTPHMIPEWLLLSTQSIRGMSWIAGPVVWPVTGTQ